MSKTCAATECVSPVRSRNATLCEKHYMRWRRYGSFDSKQPEGIGRCLQCGTVFGPETNTRKRFCSSRCSARYNRGRSDKPMVCRFCGKQRPGRSDLQYCSERCARSSHTAAEHGLSPEAYQQLLRQQGGRCAACRSLPSTFFHIDHSHTTGQVRSILCDRCNPALGKLHDDPRRAYQLAAYLQAAPPIVPAPQKVAATGRGNRQCRLCGQSFTRVSAKARYCSPVHQKRAGIIRRFKLEPEQYRYLLEQQAGRCRCCGDWLTAPHVDHQHADGVIRGLLCKDCNLAAGLVLDDPQRALALAHYLERVNSYGRTITDQG